MLLRLQAAPGARQIFKMVDQKWCWGSNVFFSASSLQQKCAAISLLNRVFCTKHIVAEPTRINKVSLKTGDELNNLIGLSHLNPLWFYSLHTQFPLMLMGSDCIACRERRNTGLLTSLQKFKIHYHGILRDCPKYSLFVIYFLVNATIWEHCTLLSRKHFRGCLKHIHHNWKQLFCLHLCLWHRAAFSLMGTE